MNRASYATAWKAIGDRQNWELEERLCRNADWQKPFDPESMPGAWTVDAFNTYLRYRIWALGHSSDLARFCIEFARDQSQKAIAADAFNRGRNAAGFPRNRADFLVAKVFVDGILDAAELDRSTVLQIAADRAVHASTYGRREWDAAPQSDYQHAIDLLLLVDARAEAQAMVDNARSMRGLHVKELFATAKLILKSTSPVRDDQQAKREYRRVFDILRNPAYADGLRGHPGGSVPKLIMACVWQKFFEPGDGAYDYDKAIDLIWE